MSAQLTLRSLSAATIKAMLDDGTELALIDVREELTFSQNHLLWARNVPLSRLELRFARLVPRLTTRIVLCDDNDGLAKRVVTILANAGYTDLSYLQGGIAAWAAAGFVLFSGVTFQQSIRPNRRTRQSDAQRWCGELDAMMRNGPVSKCSTTAPSMSMRAFRSQPASMPGRWLVLRVAISSPHPARQSSSTSLGEPEHHRRAIAHRRRRPDKVVALRNGTMGWHLAGLACDSGDTTRAPAVSGAGLRWAKSAAAAVARKIDIGHIDPAKLDEFLADPTRTTYIFDVRDPDGSAAGLFPGAVSAPGGQLVQATDLYAGTLGAHILLSDDEKCTR